MEGGRRERRKAPLFFCRPLPREPSVCPSVCLLVPFFLFVCLSGFLTTSFLELTSFRASDEGGEAPIAGIFGFRYCDVWLRLPPRRVVLRARRAGGGGTSRRTGDNV